nr:ADP-ribosylglycohydrolase family protein [Streptomyces erythrochromogenes]
MRLTWAQPEDLVGHELRQAAEDGRDPGPAQRAWLAAGGHPAPERAGASPTPAPPHLRALAARLLDELARLPSPLAADEPTAWAAIAAACPTAASPAPAAPLPTRPRHVRPEPAHLAVGPGRRGPAEGHGQRPDQAHAPAGRAPGAAPEPAPHPEAAPEPRPTRAHTPANEGPVGPAPGNRPAQAARTGAADTQHPTRAHTPTDQGPGEPSPGTGPEPVPRTEAAPEPVPRTEAAPEPQHAPPDAPPSRGPVGPAPGTGPAPAARTGAAADGQRPAQACARTGQGPSGPAASGARPGGGGLRGRFEAAWVGRAVGCLLGKPVEKLPLEGIRALARATGNWPLGDWFTARGVPPELLAAHPWNRRSAPTSLAENIDGMPEDDDLNYPLLGLLLLQRHGKAFTTADVARLWLDELPAGRTFTAERVAYRNLLLGLEPPATATHHNPFREWIGALIRADVHGWTNPGDPVAAAAQAYRDAALTHTGNGVYAALFVAAATAEAATGRSDVHTALRAGLAAVPPRSRLAEAIRFGIRTAADEADFDLVVDLLHARYGHYHWVHAVPNTALIAAALTHADGDFTRSVCRAVSGGWDTDSNGATAGAVAGLLAGSPERIPHRWTAPLKNRLATSVPGFDGIGFDTLAHLTAQEAARS